MTAVAHGHMDTMLVLLDLGANIHAQDVYRRTALHRAVSIDFQIISMMQVANMSMLPFLKSLPCNFLFLSRRQTGTKNV